MFSLMINSLRKRLPLPIAGLAALIFTRLPLPLPAAVADNTTPAKVPERSEATRVAYVSPKIARGWIEQGRRVIFLDVRVPEEYAAAHLPNAINIYYSEVTAVADRLPPGDPLLVIYCTHSAYRAPAAAKILREVGVSSAYVLEGGIVAWQAGGLMILAQNSDERPRILPPPDCTCAGVKKT